MIKRIVFISLLVFIFTSDSWADTLYLRNGRSIEGLIKKEKDNTIELDIGFGTVKFHREEILRIERSGPEEETIIRKAWQEQRKLEEKKQEEREKELEEARRREEFEPKEVGFYRDSEHIVVDALLNKKVNASLMLDTGASVMLLSNDIAKKLDVRGAGAEIVQVQMADGRKKDAKFVVLDTVSVEGAEAENVEAVILLDSEAGIEDGLLGMSFLNKFNFQIDTVKRKLILKKRR